LRVSTANYNTFLSYIEVLKPRETVLLVFIGACSAVIAAPGNLRVDVLIPVIIAITLGSAGCNGLTNYLDREVDARALRTRDRAFPSMRLYPAQKALPLIIGLILAALLLAYLLNPVCFTIGIIGTIASAVWRKTISCTFLGIIAGCSPVLIGWFAVQTELNLKIVLICLLLLFWIPLHIWSVMIAHRDDYLAAGLTYFPLNLRLNDVIKILFVLVLFLFAVTICLYAFTDLNVFYFWIADILGILMVVACARLLFAATSKAAWQVYKLSSFPYLGIIFLAMCVDTLFF
jgi:protoheme IX farnesyltransferase